ncbi:Mce family protein [Gordonia effusa NBRC 100432]|uniref:Mce family protein n=1 Tax=Gordonia effusa NBRC 100432 TaxID=1077974 RepID=H0R5M7_9ACTN|nr:MlaD family protein [Gordonia effusa]GAB20378.1 Mce family protein [Gordonia effusa NBRC 100432]
MMSVKKELSINVVTFAVVILVCGIYLASQVYRWNPVQEYSTVSMEVRNTDLVLRGTGVFVDGVRTGEVSDVRVTPTGATLTLRYPRDQRIARDTNVEISMQSALGEPYINFESAASAGPYLRDGDRIAAERIEQPESIPAIFDLITNLTSVIAADPMASLLHTAWEALEGTDQAWDDISHGSQLIARMLLSHSPQLRTMFVNTQRYSGDLGWLVSALPEFGSGLGVALDHYTIALRKVERLIVVTDLHTTLQQTLNPFLIRLNGYLAKILPPTMDAIGPLMPIATALNQTLPQINVSELLSNALQLFGSGKAARLVVTVPPR